MSNAITEGKDRELPPDRYGEIRRTPTPAAVDLQAEILEASRLKEAGQGEATRSRSSIESRTDLRLAATNEAMRVDPTRTGNTLAIEQETARRWADLDASDFGRIRSDSRRENALEAIAGHVRVSPEYAEELKKRSPVLADATRAINEKRTAVEREIKDEQLGRLVGASFDAKVGPHEEYGFILSTRVPAIPGIAAPTEQAAYRRLGETARGIVDKPDHYLREYLKDDALKAIENAREKVEARPLDTASRAAGAAHELTEGEQRELAKQDEARRERDAAAEQRRGSISAAAQSRATLIDSAALAALANVRTRETARVAAQLASSPDAAMQQLRDAQHSLKAPPLDGRVTAANDPDIAAQHARAIKRPVAEEDLSQALLTRYIVSREKQGLFDKGAAQFTFRSGEEQGRVAFVDAGKTLSTERDDKSTIRAMLEVAAAKNWKEITVSGTDDFRRNAWLEASLNGIKVRGYEPREADKQILAELQERHKPANLITAVEREHKPKEPGERSAAPVDLPRKHVDGDALTAHERTVLDNSRAILNSKALGEQFTEATLRELEAKLRGERIYIGEIVDHGPAPYKFDKDNDRSYYVTLRTRDGEQVIWGKGLPEAMLDRRVGEQIVLQNVGKRDVIVNERVRDAHGEVIGMRPKESQLNAWKSELLSRFSEKTRSDFSDRAAGRQPLLTVYDAKASRATTQPAAPARPSEQQRSVDHQRNARER
jgi:hypothetical protein